MSGWRNARTITGFLAVASTLALLSPGVNTVRAEGSSAALPEGPTCEAGNVPITQEAIDVLAHLQQLEARKRAAQPEGPPDPDDIVVLNGRGYND